MTAKTAEDVSDITIRNYHQNLHNISFDIKPPFDLLTKEMLDEMVVSMRKSGLAHNTIATYVRQLRTFLNWYNGEGLTAVMLPNMKEKETVKEAYTDEELARILKKPARDCGFCEYRAYAFANSRYLFKGVFSKLGSSI